MQKSLKMALLAAVLHSGTVLADARAFELPAQPLDSALVQFARQAGIEILFKSDEVKALRGKAVYGQFPTEDGLRRLLADSGLSFTRNGPASFIVRSQPANQKALPPVLVTAPREASYKAEQVTIAGKLPSTPREIPNSVSVLTRAQMDDQNLVTTWDALSQITGVQAISNDMTQGQYHSRGGALEVQHDGIPSTMPLSGYQQFDLGMYERIEVQRGPTGLLQGSGSFSGAVNFVRKRPLDLYHSEFVAAYGSWNNQRLSADVTGPLNDAGTARGRLVASLIDRDYPYDRVHQRKWMAYGTLEFDLTPQTRTNVYFARQEDRTPGFSGLPTYTNGQFLSVPRSFNPYPDWNRMRWETTDLGAELSHQAANAWTSTLRAYRRDQRFFFHDSYPTTGVDPATNLIGNYARREFDYHYVHDGADLFSGGEFDLLGRSHKLLLGANYSRFESTGKGANPNSPSSGYLNYANVLLGNSPAVPDVNVIYRAGSQSVTQQSGLYGRLTLNVTDPLKVILGSRFSNFSAKSRTIEPHPTPTAWAQGAKSEGYFSSYAGVVYDLTSNLTLYGSYADIFVPQTQLRVDNTTLDPRTGKQYEVGSKMELLDGKLLTTFAAFEIRDTNRAMADANNPGYYLTAGELESKGWEMEVVGKLTSRWDVSAGYTNLITRWVNNGSSTGQPVSFWYPKELYKVWSKYRFGEGPLSGFSFGMGLNGATQSASGTSTPVLAARSQNGYTTLKLQFGYEIDRNHSVTLDINNALDDKYYTRLGGTNTYNTYGDPRNLMLTLRARY